MIKWPWTLVLGLQYPSGGPLKRWCTQPPVRTLGRGPGFLTVTQSADFQFAEIAWKSWKGSATWFYFFRGKESSSYLLGCSSSQNIWCDPRTAGSLGLSWEGSSVSSGVQEPPGGPACLLRGSELLSPSPRPVFL